MVTAAWLRRLGEDGLAALLRRRPEAVAGLAPVSLGELAERLSAPSATVTALRRLDRPTLQVAEAMAALGGRTDRPALDRLLGVTTPERAAAVTRAVDILRADGLLTGQADLTLAPAVTPAWPRPLGLGAPVAVSLAGQTADSLRRLARELGLKPAVRRSDLLDQVTAALRDEDLVRSVVRGAPTDARELLDKVAAEGVVVHDDSYYVRSGYARAQTAVRWAATHGMLVRTSQWDADLEMPAEVALALRGPTCTAPFDPVPPLVTRTDVDAATIADSAAAAGSALVRLMALLLDESGRKPLAMLRSGGVGARELRRVAKVLACAEPELRLALAVAVHAGLLAVADGRAAPTTGYDDWRRHDPADRLAVLLTAWWTLPYAPLAAEGAVKPDEHAVGTVPLRAAIVGEAAEPAGSAVAEPGALVALTVWRQPYAFGDPETAPARARGCWDEAALLGVVAAGAVTPAGLALRSGAEELAQALGDIGDIQRTVRLQGDLTAIVAGTPDADLSELLDLAADAETRGTAQIWRFSPASVRRALDAGHTADGLTEALGAVAADGLPQPLRYLIGDVGRRHGVVRASAVTCCLRGDDTALLAEIVADRRLRALGLRLLAPTVLAADTSLPHTLAALRNAGYAPVAEAGDGAAIVERASQHRTETPTAGTRRRALRTATRAATPTATGAAGAGAAELARTLLAAPDEVLIPTSPSLEAIRLSAVHLTTAEARVLAHAIDDKQPVAIHYVNRDGNPSSRVIDDIQLTGGSLLAYCRLREDQRWFNPSRIIAVEPILEVTA
jgi:hypothetical protein